MATVTDTIRTVLTVVGIGSYINEMRGAATATARVIATVKLALLTLGNLSIVMTAIKIVLAGVILLFVAAAAAVAAWVATLKAGLSAYGDYEPDLLRTALLLKNIGASLPIAELRQYAEARGRATSTDAAAIQVLYAQLLAAKLTRTEVESLVPLIQDTAAGTGTSMAEVGAIVRRYALSGQPRGLAGIGVNITELKKGTADIAGLTQQLEGLYKGLSGLEVGTIRGAFEGLALEVKYLFRDIGNLIAPPIVWAVGQLRNLLASVRGFFNDTLIGQFMARAFLGPISWFGTQESRDLAAVNAEGVTGAGFGSKDSDNLEDVKKNTGKMVDSVTRLILGGGPLTTQALNIRGLNAALRAAR